MIIVIATQCCVFCAATHHIVLATCDADLNVTKSMCALQNSSYVNYSNSCEICNMTVDSESSVLLQMA